MGHVIQAKHTRVIVTGGREFTDYHIVAQTLTELRRTRGPLFVIHGGAEGADSLAKTWAANAGLPSAEVRALWGRYDKRAGSTRNAWMLLLQPELVVAFPGGSGTHDMVTQALEAGVPVHLSQPYWHASNTLALWQGSQPMVKA